MLEVSRDPSEPSSWLGYSTVSLLQKSGVSVEQEKVPSISATMFFLPTMNAAPPADAVYSRASPGLL